MFLNLDKLSRKELITGTCSLIILITFFTVVIISGNKRDESIKNNRFYRIGKVTEFTSNRSFDNYTFMYYYNGRKYDATNSIKNEDEENCIGKYYKIELSIENPSFSNIFLEEPVSDMKNILNAGFRIEEKFKWKFPIEEENKNEVKFIQSTK